MKMIIIILLPILIYVIFNFLVNRITTKSIRIYMRILIATVCLSVLYINHFLYNSGNLLLLLLITFYIVASFVVYFVRDRK